MKKFLLIKLGENDRCKDRDKNFSLIVLLVGEN